MYGAGLQGQAVVVVEGIVGDDHQDKSELAMTHEHSHPPTCRNNQHLLHTYKHTYIHTYTYLKCLLHANDCCPMKVIVLREDTEGDRGSGQGVATAIEIHTYIRYKS